MPNSHQPDLTGYAALIGQSFESRVDLLERLLRSRHYPTLGAYKERLLASAIRDFLPRTASVGTGFVIFPRDEPKPIANGEFFDELNQSGFDVSRQCDVLVYDSLNYPPVFCDNDFVILRPEAVIAVIEVKGNGSNGEIRSSLQSFLDFSKKWQDTQRFYREHHQALSRDPQLHCFCWSHPARRQKDAGEAMRELVCQFYRDNVKLAELGALPLLSSLMIYNEWEISETQGINGGKPGEDLYQLGWHSRRGKFVRVNEEGDLFLDRDRTVASLLSKLHWAVSRDKFNRFFSYPDEVKSKKQVIVEQSGVSWAWETPDVGPLKRNNSCELP